MEIQKLEDLNWLEEWSGREIPDLVLNLSPEVIDVVRKFIEESYEAKIQVVKKAILANEVTLKFIPNFISIHILKNFIEPEMAALIAETLSLDLTMPIIKGLDVEYISQSMVYLKAEVSAEILLKLENFKIQKILDRILKLNPLKVLDILHHIPETKKKYVSVSLSVDQFQNIHLSETRKKILNEWSTKTF